METLEEAKEFHWADYVVFVISLILSLAIGVFFFIWDRRNKGGTKEFLVGGATMNPIAVGLSIAASLLNAVFLIGVPAEVHYFGTIYSLIGVAWVIVVIIAAHIFVPFFRNSPHISCYEYLGDRFNSLAVRLAASATFAISILLFLAVVLYAPALAFQAVTGMSIHLTQILCGGICTLYVVMGGLKAVVWTDAFQMVIVVAGTLMIALMGAKEVGGGWEVWDIVKENNRINFDTTSHDPTVRHTIWTQVIGQACIWLPVFGSNQMAVQRYYAVSSNLKAQFALYSALFVVILLLGLVTACGLVMYAFYFKKGCDPFVAKQIERADQMFPLLMMEVLGDYHGLPGLYVAAVFAAALSSVSSAVNSLAAVILEDFIKPIYKVVHDKEFSDKTATHISRALSLLFGLVTIALSYIAPFLGDELIQIPNTIWGVVGAPLFGVFILAMFFPCSNASGALTGLFVSIVFSLWLSIGGIIYGRSSTPLMPLSVSKCGLPPICGMSGGADDGSTDNFSDFTSWTTTWDPTTSDSSNGTSTNVTDAPTTRCRPPPTPAPTGLVDLEDFYTVSYAWYGLINIVICVFIGLLVSLVVDGIYYGCAKKAKQMDGALVYDCGQRCCCYLPPTSKLLACFRCNVKHESKFKATEYEADNPAYVNESQMQPPKYQVDNASYTRDETLSQTHQNGRSYDLEEKSAL